MVIILCELLIVKLETVWTHLGGIPEHHGASPFIHHPISCLHLDALEDKLESGI